MTADDVATFSRCITVGGVAVFPADTVYGLACEPDTTEAVRRLYGMKRRGLGQPSAVMFFDRELAFDALPELGDRTRRLAATLLPGAVSLLLPNPAHRFPLACGDDLDTLGLRVPLLEGELAPLAEMRWPILQSSANRAGQPEAHRLADVDPDLAAECDMLLDGGTVHGTASTVIDLRAYELDGTWSIVRQGAVDADTIAAAVAAS